MRYDLPTTMIGDTQTPKCNEVRFKGGVITFQPGSEYFASTNTEPLSGIVMMLDQFFKTDGSERLIVFTTTDAYWYNTTTKKFVLLTKHTTNLVCRVQPICISGTAEIDSTVVVGKSSTVNLVSRVNVSFRLGQKNLVSRVIVRIDSECYLYCSVTVV